MRFSLVVALAFALFFEADICRAGGKLEIHGESFPIRDLCVNGRYVWAATDGSGVIRWDIAAGTYTRFLQSDGLAGNFAYSIGIGPDGNVWAGIAGIGASRFDGENWTTFKSSCGLGIGGFVDVWDIAAGPDGATWFGTTYGVACFDGESWTQYGINEGDYVRCIATGFQGDIWFGTLHGVSRFDGETWITYDSTDGLWGDNVLCIAASHDGSMWFSSSVGHISRFDGKAWTYYTTPPGLGDNTAWSIAASPDSSIWFGSDGLGVSRFDGKTWKTFTTADGLPSNRVQALAVDHNGVVWIGTDKGLVSYTGENIPVFVAGEASKPMAFLTISVYPNPFNPSTLIECTISQKGLSELSVYSITGQKIKTIASGNLSAGKHRFLWDGKDDSGNAVSSGTYIARLKSGNGFTSQKMVLIK